MKITRAVITAAGLANRNIPFQSFIGTDGKDKPAISILIDEVKCAGIEDVGLVVSPGNFDLYARMFRNYSNRVHLIVQNEPLGYGHALLCSRDFVGKDSFLHLVEDHLYIASNNLRCAQQVIEVAQANNCSISAVERTREKMLRYYGAIGGRGIEHKNHLYQIDKVLEKPTPTLAEQELNVPGLRSGFYLCFFGIHVFTSSVLEILEDLPAQDGVVSLSPALAELAQREKYLAYEVCGKRYNLGQKFGFLNAQLALALAGEDRDEVLSQLVELLATRAQNTECAAG